MIKAILFDMDGTLLPMDIEVFTKAYFQRISTFMSSYGYESNTIIHGIWKGTEAMVKNDGSSTNEAIFWKEFSKVLRKDTSKDMPIFTRFYIEEFDQIQTVCGYTNKALKLIDFLKTKNCKLVLATNPIFPMIAQEKRLSWTGIKASDFSWITSYENSHYCKPNLKYYEEILSHIKCQPNECIMIGNDVDEDMIASKLGMKVFLLTDCIINKHNLDLSLYPHGDYNALFDFLDRIL